jgi:hypothetical protein
MNEFTWWWWIVILLLLLFLCYIDCSCDRRDITYRQPSPSPDTPGYITYERLPVEEKSITVSNQKSRGEAECARVLLDLLPNYSFRTSRPSWLINSYTGNRLELDLYCPELRLAVEFNGEQHYVVVPKFHPYGARSLYGQQQRDLRKRQKCLEHGVDLIVVKFDVIDIYSYLCHHPMILSRLRT